MTDATYIAAAGSLAGFDQVIDGLNLISDGDLSNTSATSCTITVETDLGTLAATLTGSGFAYDNTPDLSLVGGTLTGISLDLGGVHQGDVTTSLAVADFVAAAMADETSDPAVLEHFLMAINWTYQGNATSEVASQSDVVGDDVPFNLTGNDTISLGGGNDTFFAGDGDDVVNGDGGNDTINGGAGSDEIYGGNGADTLNGGADADVLVGGAGNDTINGGAGGDDFDDVWYYGEGGAHAVNIDLATGAATDTFGNADTLISIEGIAGTDLTDKLRGNDVNNIIRTFRGDDIVDGRGGNDEIHYGNDQNLLYVTVDLALGTGVEHYANGLTTDTLTSIERIRGSHGDDFLYGDGGDNVFKGLEGNDTINGRGGIDGVDYHNDAQYGGSAGVTVNLANGIAIDGFGDTDTLTNIENVHGTQFNDMITGDLGANLLIGDGGNDIINGGSVSSADLSDFLDGGAGNDRLTIVGQGQALGGLGNDRIIGATSGDVDNIDFAEAVYFDSTTGIVANLTATSHGGLAGGNTTNGFRVADGLGGIDLVSGLHVISGTDFNDKIYVDSSWTNSFGSWLEVHLGAGDDRLENDGADLVRVNYGRAGGAVNINLATGIATDANPGDAFIGTDTLIGVRDARGSAFDDTITGDGNDNQLRGRDGSDKLHGGAGNDTLYGEEKAASPFVGNDYLDGGLGADQMFGGAGNDIYFVDNAGDQVTEQAGQGNDTVLASVSYTLAANIESLKLTGTANLNGTGNGLNNVIGGNDGNNTLNGGVGADQMAGYGGNDIYVVDNVGDQVTEQPGQGNDTVLTSISHMLEANIESLKLTGTANLNGTGNGLNNVIGGNDGNNTLNGGVGADQMAGYGGNDVYFVDNAGDQVTEQAGQGNDTVLASVSYTLAANIESLKLTGTANINGTGNGLNNVIGGNDGNNTLNGGVGADQMAGYGGNDIYFVDNASDVVNEQLSTGNDTVVSSISYGINYALAANVEALKLTGTADINGTGNSLNNVIGGNEGHNIINGGVGADLMAGYGGNDTYFVDNIGDQITEQIGQGNDTVLASVSYAINYALAANIENIKLTGSANINGTGNDLDNVIGGNDGNNILNGGAGVDQLAGGSGNDTYFVDNIADQVIELAGQGNDTVLASGSYWLGANIETLKLTGDAFVDSDGHGNDLDNVIGGNVGDNYLDGGSGNDQLAGLDGNDSLDGGLGNDILTGGAGDDEFIFSTALNEATNVDLISDFSVPDDRIFLSNDIFTVLDSGILDNSEFVIAASASTSDQHIIYNDANGWLSYDADGNGGGAAVHFATLSPGLALTNNDFLV